MSARTRTAAGLLSRRATRALTAMALLLIAGAHAAGQGAARKFYDDDPLAREPETRDASKVRKWSINLTYDLAVNLFSRQGDRRSIKAQNVNTVDEVPDSNWFTNRLGARAVSADEVTRGPLRSEAGPAPGPLTISSGNPGGMSPKFVLTDSAGTTWYVQFDPPGYPESATGAAMVANKIFYALGYWQVENRLASLRPDDLRIGEGATVETPSGKTRRFGHADIARVLRRAHRSADGSYRMLAAPAIPRTLGGFKYNGTRPDDPNDIVPHEHRRELRGLRVFAAWTNLVDFKALNTIDALVVEDGQTRVRHYLQDVGSTFGAGALGPREWDEGYEYLYEGDKMWRRLLSLGFFLQPWQTIPYTEYPSIGRLEGDRFDPLAWKPRVPATALLNARGDDTFWAARRVAAFSDELIRAAVRAGAYSDPAAQQHLVDVLITRRNRIAQAYLPAVNPVVDPVLDTAGRLSFRNAAVDAKVADEPPAGYVVSWSAFDNTAGTRTRVGEPAPATREGTTAPAALPAAPGTYVVADIRAEDPAHPSWKEPVHAYFRRVGDGWRLVGLERQP